MGAPAWLSGLGDNDLELYRRNWASKHFAPDLDRMERLGKAVIDANRAGTAAIEFGDLLTNAKMIEQATKSEKVAADALAAVRAS